MEALISLLILVIIVGVVYYVLTLLVNMLDEPFRKIAHILLILICVLVVLAKALPLLGVNIGI